MVVVVEAISTNEFISWLFYNEGFFFRFFQPRFPDKHCQVDIFEHARPKMAPPTVAVFGCHVLLNTQLFVCRVLIKRVGIAWPGCLSSKASELLLLTMATMIPYCCELVNLLALQLHTHDTNTHTA